MNYEISKEQIEKVLNIVLEIPTKMGLPIVQILNGLKKVEEKIPDDK